MEKAAEIAREGISSGSGGPFGCVIVKDGNVVACTHNTVVRDNDPTAHGEVNAIRQACRNLGTFNLEGCDLYTTSEPCPMCLGAIMWARIGNVYSAMNIRDAADIGFDDEPFYADMNSYSQGKGSRFVNIEFRENVHCRELFRDYKAMNAVKY